MKRSLLAAAAMLMATAAAHAADNHGVDGQLLYSECREPSTFCMGYVRASADWVGVMVPGVCVPPHATAQTVTDVVMRWLATHPEKRTSGGIVVVTTALSEAYPCRKS